MLKNALESDRPHTTVWRMRSACCIHKATNTHSEYVIPIAFLQQQWLHKHALLLHYTYTARIVRVVFFLIIVMGVSSVLFKQSCQLLSLYRGADKSLARPGKKQASPVKSAMGRGMD